MIKKRRLKRWVRVTIGVLITLIFFGILTYFIVGGINNFNELARECDSDRGYTCSYYEINQYRR